MPEAGKSYLEDIQYYRSLLSCIRLLPEEIWHKIFEYAVLDIQPGYNQIFAVEAIRLVCRGWASSIENCPTLWTHVPLLNLNKTPISKNGDAAFERATYDLHPYLQRSVNKPITFTFQFWPQIRSEVENDDAWNRTGEVMTWLQVLHYNWDRWGEAEFRTSRFILRVLSDRIRKYPRLDNLTKFSYQMRGVDSPGENMVETLDLSKAPHLKHFTWDTLGLHHRAPYQKAFVYLNLPWRQLESFEVALHDGIPTYARMVHKGTNLRVLSV